MKIILTLLVAVAFSGLTANAQDGGKKGPKMNPEAIFKKKDTDGDGKLSKDEFTKGAKEQSKAEEAFSKKDKDGDGSLSVDEFKSGHGPAKGKKGKKGN
jgi:Ca2+-binding EF-hand superfamily protein